MRLIVRMHPSKYWFTLDINNVDFHNTTYNTIIDAIINTMCKDDHKQFATCEDIYYSYSMSPSHKELIPVDIDALFNMPPYFIFNTMYDNPVWIEAIATELIK